MSTIKLPILIGAPEEVSKAAAIRESILGDICEFSAQEFHEMMKHTGYNGVVLPEDTLNQDAWTFFCRMAFADPTGQAREFLGELLNSSASYWIAHEKKFRHSLNKIRGKA